MTDLFLRGISIDWNTEELNNSWISRIEALRNTEQLTFHRSITFFTGENGSGKSTLLESIAIALGLNPEGGTRNYRFSTFDDHSSLHRAIRLHRGALRPGWSYFLRAESFYSMTAASVRDYDGRDLHAMSHGESFLEFIRDNSTPGLYLMDEPEAALSPQNQLTLLIQITELARKGAQLIIATHSPILTGAPDAELLSFDGSTIRPVNYEETGCYRVMKLFLNDRQHMLRQMLEDH